MGAILPSRRHLEAYDHIFIVTLLSVPGICEVASEDAADQPAVHRMAPATDDAVQDVRVSRLRAHGQPSVRGCSYLSRTLTPDVSFTAMPKHVYCCDSKVTVKPASAFPSFSGIKSAK